MQSFNDLFANNKLLAVGVVLVAVAVILAICIILFRLIFGRRLHMSGGRTRQPRLGVVDAFDLDRQRQLVLIRRDNVEHLLMIGGPNDVLVEAAIVRAPVGLVARDKDSAFSPSVGIPAPVPQPASLPTPVAAQPAAAAVPPAGVESGPGLPLPAPLAPEPRVSSPPESQQPAAFEPVAPTPAPPSPPSPMPDARLPPATTLPPAGPRPLPSGRVGSTIPPRPPVTPVGRPTTAPTPRTNLSRANPVAPAASTAASPPAGRVEPMIGRLADGSSTGQGERDREVAEPVRDAAGVVRSGARPTRPDELSVSTPGLPDAIRSDAPLPSVASEGASGSPTPRPIPRPGSSVGAGRPLPPRPASPPPPVTSAQARNPMPSLGSLEEEMAKLLGRPMPPSDPSAPGG